MPYLLLGIGVLVGLYALYRFFLSANMMQIKAFFLVSLFMVLIIALLYMALTGRLPAAIAALIAMWPVTVGIWKNIKSQKENKKKDDPPES